MIGSKHVVGVIEIAAVIAVKSLNCELYYQYYNKRERERERERAVNRIDREDKYVSLRLCYTYTYSEMSNIL